jgi:hypothetical protein
MKFTLDIPLFTLNNEELEALAQEVIAALQARRHWERIRVGDRAKVVKFQWVDVLNRTPIKSGNGEFSLGGSGSIDVGGTVTVLAVIKNNDVLVEYGLDHKAYGAPLPSGAMFFLSKEEFLAMEPIKIHASARK